MLYKFMRFEAKRYLNRWAAALFIALFLLLVFFGGNGIGDYKLIVDSREPFQRKEKDRADSGIHITAIGTRGIDFLYIPSPFSAITNDSSVFLGMTGHVDTGEGFFISNSLKGKDLFAKSNGNMDVVAVMLAKLPPQKGAAVFNRFFKNRPMELEQSFVPLMKHLNANGIDIVYLNRKFPTSPGKDFIDDYVQKKDFTFQTFPYDFDKFSLR